MGGLAQHLIRMGGEKPVSDSTRRVNAVNVPMHDGGKK
jgi:hypothetical protein